MGCAASLYNFLFSLNYVEKILTIIGVTSGAYYALFSKTPKYRYQYFIEEPELLLKKDNNPLGNIFDGKKLKSFHSCFPKGLYISEETRHNIRTFGIYEEYVGIILIEDDNSLKSGEVLFLPAVRHQRDWIINGVNYTGIYSTPLESIFKLVDINPENALGFSIVQSKVVVTSGPLYRYKKKVLGFNIDDKQLMEWADEICNNLNPLCDSHFRPVGRIVSDL